jgi:hypothetical protein
MKKILFVTIMAVCLGGCAGTNGTTPDPTITAGKSLITIQRSIVALRDSIGVPCQQKVISPADCTTLNDWYLQSKPIYDAAADAGVVALTTGDLSAYNANKAALQSLLTNMLAITVKYGVGGAK